MKADELIREGIGYQSRGQSFEASQCFTKAIAQDKKAQLAYLHRSILYIQYEYSLYQSQLQMILVGLQYSFAWLAL